MKQKRFKIIACEIVYRELSYLVSQSPYVVDTQFLPKGLHDVETDRMRATIQDAIDATDPAVFDAVLLGYGLCNGGASDLRARTIPLVIPKAHDCITFFFGSRHAYREFFDKHPGTYYRTVGWSERDFPNVDGTVMDRLGLAESYEDYVTKYGPDNARYIMEMIGKWEQHYDRIVYVDMGVVESLGFDKAAEDEAGARSWKFQKLTGSLDILRGLVNGDWRDDVFVVVPPGFEVYATNNDDVLGSKVSAQP